MAVSILSWGYFPHHPDLNQVADGIGDALDSMI